MVQCFVTHTVVTRSRSQAVKQESGEDDVPSCGYSDRDGIGWTQSIQIWKQKYAIHYWMT